MAVFILLAVLFFSFNGYSSATYCLCKDGVGDATLLNALNYACGFGADCTAVQQGGSCYQPNTVKAHCDYAVNSYYQRKGQATGTCDFVGSASISTSPPTTVVSGCTYPASPSLSGSTPTTPTTGTPKSPGTPNTTGTPTTTGTPPPPPSSTSLNTTGTPTTTGTPPPSSTSSGIYGGTTTGIAPTSFSSSQDFLHCSVTITLTLLFSSLLLKLR
ncbi:hypothetical protein Droror1_Dr00008260 [Drosera rotundifolia]